jgi:hypothetical protein
MSEFFGVTESVQHVANESRIAFLAESIESINKLARVAIQACAGNVEAETAAPA